MVFYAGMDIGGSHARLVLAGPNGAVLGEFTGAGGTINVVGRRQAERLYTALVCPALVEKGLDAADCAGLCVAASGVDSPQLAETCKAIFTGMGFAAAATRVVNDCEVYLLDSRGPAIVLTVGTGSIACGRTPGGAIVRCGGWGHLLSDEGSGFYMGLRVLQAVGNHLDGRAQCPALWDLFSAASPLRAPLEINQFAVENLANKAEIARFAPLLDTAAARGDAVAKAILADCVARQYQLVADTYQKLDAPENERIPVLLWGSVLVHSKPVAAALCARIENSLPASTGYPPRSALETALRAALRTGR